MRQTRSALFKTTLAAAALFAFAPVALAQENGNPTPPANEITNRPLFGAEFEFAGRGNRIPTFENMKFENYEKIMRVIVEHYNGNPRDIKKVEWKVPHPSGEGERTLFRAEWRDARGKKWLIEPEYVATRGLDGYELVTPPMENSTELREVIDKVRNSGLVREGLKSGSHIHVDGRSLVTPNGNATGLVNLINMHENYEPLLRRLFNPVRGGGFSNRFAQPLYLTHSELLNEISNLPEAERTKAGLERVFRKYTAKEMRVHGITELNAEGWKKMWKYNNLNLKNILNINEALPAEIGTVEFRMNDVSKGETHRLQIELYRRMVERAAELAAQGKVVKYERPANFSVAEGVDPNRLLTPENPREAKAQIREMIETLGLDPLEFKELLERNIRPRTIPTEAEFERRLNELPRGRVLHNGEAFTYGFELEGRGSGFVEISRPVDAEVNSRWDRMSKAEKVAYYNEVVGENHREVKNRFKLDVNRFPYLDGSMKIEGSGNWEIRSNVFESVGEATDKMREVKRLTGKSAKGFHLHMRDNAPNWEHLKANGPKFADFMERAGYWVWFNRVLSKRTDLSLKSWSNAPFTPETLKAIAEMNPRNHARHTLRVAKNLQGGNNLDIEIRGFTLDVNNIERLAKMVTENLRTGNFGSWGYLDNVLPHGGGHGDAPKELKFLSHMENYLRVVEGAELTTETRRILNNLQKKYPDLSKKSTRALPSNLGVPLLPWDKEKSLEEPARRTMKYAREEYLRRIWAQTKNIANGKYGFDINVASEKLLQEKLGLTPTEAKKFSAFRAANEAVEYSRTNELVRDLIKNRAAEGVNMSEVKVETIGRTKLKNLGMTDADARFILKVRKAANALGEGKLVNLDYNAIERASRGHVKKWVQETNIEREIRRSLLPNPETAPRGEGFANRRRAVTPTGELKISSSEINKVFESLRETIAKSADGKEGRTADRTRAANLEVVKSGELIMEYNAESNKIRISEATLNEIHNRSLKMPPTERVAFRRKALGILMGHELAHSSGVKAERAADLVAVEALKNTRGVGVIDGVENRVTRNDIKETLRVFERPTGSKMVDNIFYRLRQLPRYGLVSGREANLNRAAAGQADPLAKYRRADGTLKWKNITADKALQHGAGVAHFALALFLKEMAVVVKTGDKARIEEFFEGLATTDFFVVYGLFSAGAHVGNVAYSKYLEKYVKPKFVSGILRTNLVLATGMALPEIYHGTFNGKAFAINLAGLGLSTTAVKAGVASLKWVTNLGKADRTGRMAAKLAKFRSFAKVGGWFYTAAETAVVLYFGEEISAAVNKYLDDKAARNSVADASVEFFKAVSDKGLTDEKFAEALDKFNGAHVDYRNYLYKPLAMEEDIYFARLSKAARKAKILEDKRRTRLEKLERFPALKATVLRKYGSLEKYAEHLAKEDEKELDEQVGMYLESYNLNREAHLKEVYTGNKRGGSYLNSEHALWVANGAKPGAAGDPFRGRSDYFARSGREGVVEDFRDAAFNVSKNRIEAYSDQEAALRLALKTTDDPEKKKLITDLINALSEIKEKDKELGSITSDGAVGALRGNGPR